MAKTQEVLYAAVGAGDFAIEKIKRLPKIAERKTTQKYYKDFVKRGKSLSNSIRNSAPTKRAISQTKSASRQVKTAGSSIGKAAKANADATKSAANKTAKAS